MLRLCISGDIGFLVSQKQNKLNKMEMEVKHTVDE